ncbi:MAG: hypothetical protein ACK4MF_06625 [Hyphomicrobiaceae bacterium]
MVTIYNPNILAVAGLIITACGLGFLAKAILASTMTASADAAHAKRAAAAARVDLAFAAPVIIAGIVTMAAAQFVSSALSPVITALLLAMAFGLVLYAGYEALLTDSGATSAAAAQAAGASRLKLIAAPVAVAPAASAASASAGEDAVPTLARESAG